MGNFKSQQIVALLHPLELLVLKYRVHTALAKESHIHTEVLHQILQADRHDGLMRAILALTVLVPKEELRRTLHNITDLMVDMSNEEYAKHEACYKPNAFLAKSAIKKSPYPEYHKRKPSKDFT